jgi:hypothetical protein
MKNKNKIKCSMCDNPSKAFSVDPDKSYCEEHLYSAMWYTTTTTKEDLLKSLPIEKKEC